MLVTSGLDGIYPDGLPVARVSLVERDKAYAFARIISRPLAAVENHTVVMVLDPMHPIMPSPEVQQDGNQATPSSSRP